VRDLDAAGDRLGLEALLVEDLVVVVEVEEAVDEALVQQGLGDDLDESESSKYRFRIWKYLTLKSIIWS